MTATFGRRPTVAAPARTAAVAPKRKRGFFATVLHLYRQDATYRGFTDFALIGMLVISFLPTPDYPVYDGMPPVVPQFPAPQAKVPVPPEPVALKFDVQAFASSRPEDTERLTVAAPLLESGNTARVLELLSGADPTDRNVQFLRGIATIDLQGKENFHAGQAMLEQAAAAGQLQAKSALARTYYDAPPSVARDVQRARQLLEDAVELGDGYAALQLAFAYQSGWLGTDPALSARFLEIAARHRNHDAQMLLADRYEKGVGVTKDSKKAESYLRAAAEDGVVKAQYRLGHFHFSQAKDGWGGDLGEAVVWLEKAAAADVGDAMYDLAMIHMEVAKAPPLNDVLKGFTYLRRCVAIWNRDCLYAYGAALYQGRGVPQDLSDARLYLDLAQRLGDSGVEPMLQAIDARLSLSEVRQLQDKADMMLATRPRQPRTGIAAP